MPAVKEREQKKEKEYTSLRIDVETHARLKKAAGGVPLSRYLRELSVSLSGEIESPIAQKLSRIEGKLFDVQRGFMMYQYNKAGEMVPIMPINEEDGTQIPMFAAGMIQEELEKDPNCKRVGWYYRNGTGKWKFDNKGFDEWVEKDAVDREAIGIAMEYLDTEAMKAGKSDGVGDFMKDIDAQTDDWFQATGIGRQKLIELGRKLMKQREGEKNEA